MHIEKQGENTRWVARLLAEHFDVDEMAIGYCGLKDRRAVTRQWFSVHLPNAPVPDPSILEAFVSKAVGSKAAQYQVLESCRHHKKLRRGMHQANSFVIRLRQIQDDREALEKRLQQILEQGVPNYFGEQRFGIDGGNLIEADVLLKNTIRWRPKKRLWQKNRSRQAVLHPRGGINYPAARSYFVNVVLAERVNHGNWFHLLKVPFTKSTDSTLRVTIKSMF